GHNRPLACSIRLDQNDILSADVPSLPGVAPGVPAAPPVPAAPGVNVVPDMTVGIVPWYASATEWPPAPPPPPPALPPGPPTPPLQAPAPSPPPAWPACPFPPFPPAAPLPALTTQASSVIPDDTLTRPKLEPPVAPPVP